MRFKYQLTKFNLTGLTSTGSYTECLPGLYNIYGRKGYYFFCVQRTLAKYIRITQLDKEQIMEIGEVLIFEETKRKC